MTFDFTNLRTGATHKIFVYPHAEAAALAVPNCVLVALSRHTHWLVSELPISFEWSIRRFRHARLVEHLCVKG